MDLVKSGPERDNMGEYYEPIDGVLGQRQHYSLSKNTNFIGDPFSLLGIHSSGHWWVLGIHYIENPLTSHHSDQIHGQQSRVT